MATKMLNITFILSTWNWPQKCYLLSLLWIRIFHFVIWFAIYISSF